MKYQGSKQRILNGILPLMIPEIYNKSAFVDAFCGGCSVVENMPKDVRRIANDKNKYLIAMWKSLTNDRCRKPPMRIERDFYCDVRDSYNNGDDRYTDGIKGWVGFMASPFVTLKLTSFVAVSVSTPVRYLSSGMTISPASRPSISNV